MDQLKDIWKQIVKYHFWILTVLLLIISLVAFYMARGSLDQQVAARYSKLTNDFNTVSSLEGKSRTHANSLSDAEMDKILGDVGKNVYSAWQQQYDRQVKILQWPKEALNPNNDKSFRILDSYRPFEKFLKFPMAPNEDPLDISDRGIYKNYIAGDFKRLASIIGAEWTAVMGAVGYGGGDSGDAPVDDVGGDPTQSTAARTLVGWSTDSQVALQTEIVAWPPTAVTPTSNEICYTQESLWILEAILNVIKATNGSAKENFQAAIKQIEKISIGRFASGAGAASMFSSDGSSADGDTSGGLGAGAVDPADNRYVDDKYKPILGKTFRERINSSAETDAFYWVAKRVPVRIRVKMDHAKIPGLLAEFGNGSLMIEVKQVRVNPNTEELALNLAPDPTQVAGGGDGTDASSGGDGGGGGFGIDSADISGGDGDGGPTNLEANFDSPVEIYGIVHLFNPPDHARLGVEPATPAQ
jgi:hypothetical protein